MNQNQHAENAIMVLVATYIFTNASNIDKKIAQITLENVSHISHMTVEQLAECCGVSVSSYLRFCRRMGYASFGQFKMRVSSAVEKYLYIGATHIPETFTSQTFFDQCRSYISKDFDNLEKVLDLNICDQVVDSFFKAEKIFYVDALSSTICFSLLGDLSMSWKMIEYIAPTDSFNIHLKTLLDEKSLVFIVHNGTIGILEHLKMIPQIKKTSAHIVVLSTTCHFTNAELCDNILATGIPSSSISWIMVHDLALKYLSIRYRERYIAKNSFSK